MKVFCTISNGFYICALAYLVLFIGFANGVHAYEVTSFTLINSATNTDIQTLRDGDIIDLAQVGTSLNIRANTSPRVVGSVRFGLDGNSNYRTENIVPYALQGDNKGNYANWTPALGSYTLSATPYSEKNARGTAGSKFIIKFSVVKATAVPPNQPPIANNDSASTQQNTAISINVLSNDSDSDGDTLTILSVTTPSNGKAQITGSVVTYSPHSGFAGTDQFDYTIDDGHGGKASATVTVTVKKDDNPQQGITSFTLVNAATDKDIQPLKDGDTIELAQVGTSLNIRANTNPNVVGSVRFGYNGNKAFRTENAAPYALVGDKSGDYHSWTPALGSHTLTATAYAERNAGGVALNFVTINFTVVENSSAPTNQSPTADAGADKFMNLTQGQTNMLVTLDASGSSDPDGNIVAYRWSGTPDPADTVAPQLTLGAGSYIFTLAVEDNEGAISTDQLKVTILSASNQPPVASDDIASTPENMEVTIDVLSNDHDDDGDSISIIDIVPPSNGTAWLDGSELTYIPDTGFIGTDQCDYTIEDSLGATASATVTITVFPLDDESNTYGGDTVPGLTSIQPRITIPRTSGETPFSVHVSGMDTTAAGSAHPYDELEYSWNFGDASDNEIFTHPVTGELVNANADQKGPEAAYLFRNPGTYTITLTVRGWTGSAYVTETSTVQVDVHAWSGEDRYFDPVGGNDTNNGETAATAWKSWDKLSSWINGASNRGVFLKRGTTMLADSMIYLSKSHLRLRPYGSGSDPVIKASASMPSIIYLWANNGTKVDNQVFDSIVFDGNNGQADHCISAWYKGDGIAYLKDTTFIKVTFTNDGDSGTLLNVSGQAGALERFMVWQSTFDHREGSGQGFFIALAKFVAVVGGSFSGGDAALITDHHIYPTGTPNALFRWIDFQQAISKNFCINTDSTKGTGITTRYVLIDGNNCTGTMNGLDFSNANNSSGGRFSDVIVQNNAIHDAGSIGGQGYGILGASVERIAVRDNLFYNNQLGDINITDSGVDLQSYRNDFE